MTTFVIDCGLLDILNRALHQLQNVSPFGSKDAWVRIAQCDEGGYFQSMPVSSPHVLTDDRSPIDNMDLGSSVHTPATHRNRSVHY